MCSAAHTAASSRPTHSLGVAGAHPPATDRATRDAARDDGRGRHGRRPPHRRPRSQERAQNARSESGAATRTGDRGARSLLTPASAMAFAALIWRTGISSSPAHRSAPGGDRGSRAARRCARRGVIMHTPPGTGRDGSGGPVVGIDAEGATPSDDKAVAGVLDHHHDSLVAVVRIGRDVVDIPEI